MPWKASSVMEEKVRFVMEYERDERTMTELCEVYGIARETGYVWLRRDREGGVAGLVEVNRAALRHRRQTLAQTEQGGGASAHGRQRGGAPGGVRGCGRRRVE